MSEPRFAALAAEPEAELEEIEALGGEAERAAGRIAAEPDLIRLRAVWLLDGNRPPPRFVTAYPAPRLVR